MRQPANGVSSGARRHPVDGDEQAAITCRYEIHGACDHTCLMRDEKDCGSHHSLLADIARQAMIDRGLEPEFPPAVEQQLDGIDEPAKPPGGVRDLRKLLWCSIDNDDSRDLDQLTGAE